MHVKYRQSRCRNLESGMEKSYELRGIPKKIFQLNAQNSHEIDGTRNMVQLFDFDTMYIHKV
jgi:hypothetical protein